ncbi:KICSTOR complex protein SZT2 isoform X3 [Oryzias latipes]|uniref:KICSTOR complex protein SZT2 isoform X3 n=1 Tax=Oryzias latipes TaxID=8090 RepID=UPI0009DB4F28|nr:KICSTOR complex protein SZT2 isoform X3 [Oryzias latipes]
MADRADAEVEEADHVYLLMKEDYRISRNVRLAWFLGRLNQVVWPSSAPEVLNSENELDLLSVLPKGWQLDLSPSTRPCILKPSTRATFLARRYRFIIELDLSPSTGIVDDGTGEMIFDEVFHALSRCLAGLAQPFKVPGTNQLFHPKIFITIMAYSSIIGLTSHQVLVQGCQLDRKHLSEFLHQIYQQLRALESSIAEVLHQQQEQQLKDATHSSGLQGNGTSEELQQSTSMVTADVGLVSMIRQGILALQLLPPNSSAGIIIITDGVTSVPDVAVCETLLNQLRSGTVACSFVQVGGTYSYDCSFGYIPNVELMKFISLATFGSYLPSCPDLDPAGQEMNIYHKAFLTYSFLKTPESLNSEYFCVPQHKLFNEHLVSASGNPALVMRRKKHTEKEVHAHLVSVVSVRLREGYTIRDVSLTKGGTQLEVKLVLLWKHNMHIEYLATAPWPLDPSKRSTRVEVTMEGSYDILHDISCTQRKPITSPFRTSVIRRFWNTLQSINQTDQMLVHLQSFNSVPENYTIPESTKNGVPLFYIPPGSTTPVLSLQHSGSKDSTQVQFASYWKPILSMDATFWQRWLHMHRIVIILEHDLPVPKHLHTAGNNGRYSTIQCRISHSALTSLLKDCSSFVLVEGYSYVKLIYSSSDQPPTSFYLVRVISKTPCMVLRLGFPIGTPAFVRNKIVDELREQILKLRFPHRIQNKEATPKTKRKMVGHPSPSKVTSSPAAKPALSDRPCVVVLSKPLEKLLIRYEKLPLDFRTPFIFSLENFSPPSGSGTALSMAASRTASSTLASLSRYFLHQRWVWAVQSGHGAAVTMQAIAHILSMLSEVRISEGFHFAASVEGIINLVMELPMQVTSGTSDSESHSCTIQYILFPPHSTSTKDSFSTDEDNDTEVEAVEPDTELNLVTECWVEPQSGTVVRCTDQNRHFQGLQYQEIPQAIFPKDLACMSTMMTFEYLIQLCQNKEQVCSLPAAPQDTHGGVQASDGSVHTVPFQFDLIQLLPSCQQVELFFLTFAAAPETEEQLHGTPTLPNELLLGLLHNSLEHELSDREVPLGAADHAAFMQHILSRERDGHEAPFALPPFKEGGVKLAERQDTVTSVHTPGSSREVMGSTSTLQSFSNEDLVEEDPLLLQRSTSSAQWRCYVKYLSPLQLLLTFLPASFADVLVLMVGDADPRSNTSIQEDDTLTPSIRSQTESLSSSTGGLQGSESGLGPACKLRRRSGSRSPLMSPQWEGPASSMDPLSLDNDSMDCRPSDLDTRTFVSDVGGEKDGVQFLEPPKADLHISFSRQESQQSGSDGSSLRCPIYVYNCSLEHLKEQLVHPHASRQPPDIFLRSLSQDRSSLSSWTDLLALPHKNKELVTFCNLLQEHYHQSYVKGVYRSLQQSCSISSQDVLMAMDYCEESLQEIDITAFLQTLCGHIRLSSEGGKLLARSHRGPASFVIGEGEEQQAETTVGLSSSFSVEVEDTGEAESTEKASSPTSPPILNETRTQEFPLVLLHTEPDCEVYPDLHSIIQDKFMEILSQHFQSVPSNPHYFFYCPPSSKKEENSEDEEFQQRPEGEVVSEAEPATEDEAAPILTESDTDLVVEYEEHLAANSLDEGDERSLSDSNTVNQDQDSFSILEGDSLLDAECPQLDLPPLFVHVTCSVNMKSSHGSMPIRTLPTCLGEVFSCLENPDALQSVDLNELSVTLDIFVLTLPLEIDVMTDFHHNRYTSESSVSLNRSPGQPSSYRSDEELMGALDGPRGAGLDGVSADPLSKLPPQHKFAVLATMDEIRWLLEDEIVSALRHSRVIDSATLQKVAEHVSRSSGRSHCHREEVPLQFVFGPEQSLENFKEEFCRTSLCGYVLNREPHGFYYVSQKRLRPQRLMESTTKPPPPMDPPTDARSSESHMEEAVLESEVDILADSESEDRRSAGIAADVSREALAESSEVMGPSKLEGEDSGSARDKYLAGSLQLESDGGAESDPTPKTASSVSLAESVHSSSNTSIRLRPSRVQSVVSSQGSLDSDMRGYDGGSSDSECESPASDDQECRAPLMPDFWLIVKIHQDRVKVYSHARCSSVGREELEKKEEDQDVPEFLKLHQLMVRRIGEICRFVNQRMLLQDLHDSHVCNSLLVAESEEDIWKNETLCRQSLNTSDDYSTEESYQARDYLAATMHFIPGHFACDVVWSTIIHIHPRLKMGPNMGVSRAIQALRSVLNSFCVVNRKNMFVYQERTTKAVFYLRLCETSLAGTVDANPSRCIGLARSQEPSPAEDLTGSRSSLEGSRPVGHVDKHILLLVHGVGNAGPEITDELVKVLRKRLDETTLDIITVMLVRNCKLTPADVEFIQPCGSPATEVMTFSLPQHCLTWLSPVAHYLRQNLLIFLHLPKYTDSNTAHHFKHYFRLSSELADGDIYLYNKPGGQGTGGKGIACIALSFIDGGGRPIQASAPDASALQKTESCGAPLCPEYFQELTAVLKVGAVGASPAAETRLFVRFDIWEQGNISPLQLSDKLQGALRHALCDAVMELNVLPNPLCLSVPAICSHKEDAKGALLSTPEGKELKDSGRTRSGSRVFKSSPAPITLMQPAGGAPVGGSTTPDSTTPTSKTTRRSFWGILSKPDSGELSSPKTTDDIVQEKGEEGRAARRRHKTENVKQQWSQEKVVELEQVQRKQASLLEEGDAGFLHPIYQHTCQAWITFMTNLGCPSIQQCTAEMASNFLLPSLLSEIVNLVSSLASDTTVKVFEKISSCSCPPSGDMFVPFPVVQDLSHPPDSSRSFILIGRNFHQWHCSTEQAHKGFQRFEALEQNDWAGPLQAGAGVAPRQRFLFITVLDKKVVLHSYNWSVDLGSSLNRELLRLVRWQNARAHVVHCLFNQKMGLFHHYCFSDAPVHDVESKQDPNPFLGPSMEPDALLRSAVPPPSSKEPGRMGGSGRSLAPLHFPSELLPFDEALRDVCTIRPLMDGDVVARHGGQLLEMKAAERREMERQMKIENLFVTWQQRSAQSNMPISGMDLEILKHSSRLVHYCATPLLFDPAFRKQIQEEQSGQALKKRHRSNDSTASGRDRSYSTDSADMLPNRLKEEPWLLDICNSFLQQYVQYLQSMGFILVQVRPHSPARSIARARAAMLSSMSLEGRMSFSYVKHKSEDSPKVVAPGTASYHLQRALPGGIVLMELSFQGCYFCVKQYALECSRIPMGQSVNSQGSLISKPRCRPFPDSMPVSDCALSMLFTEECDKVRDLMHVHSFSYDFHLRVVHQYLVGSHMTLRQGYQLTDFLDDFISHHPDIPKFGRNHIFQGSLSVSTGMITGHQLYNYITDHASTYGMKPLRMSKAAAAADSKRGLPEYALVDLWTSSGSYKDLEGLQHHDDFDVSLVVCHNAAPFEEQSDNEKHLLRLRFFIIMTSQRELFPRLTADMRRFKKLPQIYRDTAEPGGRAPQDRAEAAGPRGDEQDLWEDSSSEVASASTPSDGNEFYPLRGGRLEAQGLLYSCPLFPLLSNEVASARKQIQVNVEQAMGHCRRDNLWKRLFHGEHAALAKLSFTELEELLEAVHSQSVGEIDPQLDCFLTMSPAWYQSLIKVLLSRFPQNCRHFDNSGVQYLAVLNQKFTDCFVLVFLDNPSGKTSFKVVFREPLPAQPAPSSSPPPQLVSMYHHLESVINTACYNLWTGLL